LQRGSKPTYKAALRQSYQPMQRRAHKRGG